MIAHPTLRDYEIEQKRSYLTVKVHRAGLNPVDAKFLYGDKLPKCLVPIFRCFIERNICGFDFSGVITDLDPSISNQFKIGDSVFGTALPRMGTFAESIIVPADTIALKPASISHSEAAALPLVGITVLQIFDTYNMGDINHRRHLLLIGASGGVGHIALQLAKAKGMAVTAVCSSRNAAFVASFHADSVIAYDNGNVNLTSGLRAATESLGLFDLVLDTVTSNDARDVSFDYEKYILGSNLVAPRPSISKSSVIPDITALDTSRYIRLGGSPGDWWRAHCKRFLGLDLFPLETDLYWVRFTHCSPYLEQLRGYCEAGLLRPVISKHFPLSEEGVREAFACQPTRRTVGKIVIDVTATEDSSGSGADSSSTHSSTSTERLGHRPIIL